MQGKYSFFVVRSLIHSVPLQAERGMRALSMFRGFLEEVHQLMDITPGLLVRIGLVFFPPSNPDFKIMRIGLLYLINQPVLDFQDQQAVLVSEKDEIRLPALFPDGRLIPADKIRIRPGRFLEKSKDGPFARGGVF